MNLNFPNWSVEELTKIITASVALVAVIVGPFLQWRIAKRQAADNISSKRQNWIDELRKDSAESLSCGNQPANMRLINRRIESALLLVHLKSEKVKPIYRWG